MITTRRLALVVLGLSLAAPLAVGQPHPTPPPPSAHPAPPPPPPGPPGPAMAPHAALTGVQHFEVRPGGMSRVAFTSDAPLETIDGVSTATTGNLTVDLANPSRGLVGRVQITTASLRTGSDMRDEHLRGDNWLDAAHHADIVFELTGTDLRTPLAPGAAANGHATGRLTLHGVTHDVRVPVTVRLIPLTHEHEGMAQFGVNADMLRVQSEFEVHLTDYGVSIMAPLRLKVSNTIRLRVDLTSFHQG